MLSVTQNGKTVLLTKDSDPVAVLFPIDLYESIRQYIEETQDVNDIKNALEKQEKAIDFVEFDAKMRRKQHLPKYVQNHSEKQPKKIS